MLELNTVEVSINPKLTSRGNQPDTQNRTEASDAPIPPFTTPAAEKQLLARQIDAQRQADMLPNLLRRT